MQKRVMYWMFDCSRGGLAFNTIKMRVGRKSSAEAGSFLVTLMALKICLLQLVMQASLSLGTRFESISMISTVEKKLFSQNAP